MPANWIKEHAESNPEHTESEGRNYQLYVLRTKRMGNQLLNWEEAKHMPRGGGRGRIYVQ